MFINVRQSRHYKEKHEKSVPWSLVVKVIFTGKQKRKGENIIEFTSRSKKQIIYVLCREEGEDLIVINAKRKRLRV